MICVIISCCRRTWAVDRSIDRSQWRGFVPRRALLDSPCGETSLELLITLLGFITYLLLLLRPGASTPPLSDPSPPLPPRSRAPFLSRGSPTASSMAPAASTWRSCSARGKPIRAASTNRGITSSGTLLAKPLLLPGSPVKLFRRA